MLAAAAAPAAAQCVGGVNGTAKSFTYLLQNEFQDGRPAGSITPACIRDLIASVSAQISIPNSPLPGTFFSVAGNQFISDSGVNVRLACIGYENPPNTPAVDFPKMRAAGFNCVRVNLWDKNHCPSGVCSFTTLVQGMSLDGVVAAATANGIRVVFVHGSNEGITSLGACKDQQANGLWYDVNSPTIIGGVSWNTLLGNQNGCGDTGTVTYATFKSNMTQIAARYAGNSTVIGYDMHNEPIMGTPLCTPPGCPSTVLNWGGNNGSDLRLMCQDTGSAVETAAPGVLIICEGPINVTGVFLDGGAFPGGLDNIQDLTKAASVPVNITSGGLNRVAYSVHDYPNSVTSSTQPQTGAAAVTNRTRAWGSLVVNNTAPVWIGEMGGSLDNTNGVGPAETDWANTLTSYMNGHSGSFGGPTFVGSQQAMSGDWWYFGFVPGAQIDGIYTNTALTTLNTFQQVYWSTILYTAHP